ncbi:F-box/kelch-repeat protein At3g06240-like [Coffea arabica]|uniref:F-box/kelch-repeat protein At3g06240-like n=1 Tax=Coffea arabica TaxID=13443 RepID=A0A6P6W2I5_COFAR|nr:F-box protein CPR1-like [Coffea arabica]
MAEQNKQLVGEKNQSLPEEVDILLVLELKPPIDFVSGSCSVVDSCAGLLCLTENDDVLYGRVVYLWNPSVRRIITIRNSSCEGISKEFSWISPGCGYDFDAGVFKLVRIIYDSPNCEAPYDLEKTEIEVYNLSTGSWRKIENLVVNWIIYCQLRILYVNGFVNWLAFHPERHDEDLIVAFDVKSEDFRTLELPDLEMEGDYRGPLLKEYKDMLAFFVCGNFAALEGTGTWSLWVMREYGVTNSWERLFNVVTEQRIVWSLGVTKNCDILLLTPDSKVVAYDFKEQEVKNLGLPKYCPHSCFLITYMESLLLLDEQANLDGHMD